MFGLVISAIRFENSVFSEFSVCRKDDFEVSFKLLSRTKEDGVSPNFIMCRCITSKLLYFTFNEIKHESVCLNIALMSLNFCLLLNKGLCKRRFEKSCAAGEPVVSFKSGRPQIENKWSV